MLSGLKLTPFADNALFFGLSGGHSQFGTIFDAAFVVWRKQGVISKVVDSPTMAIRAPYPGAGRQAIRARRLTEAFKF